jgi:nicotinate phosphoribosyltransferase
MPYALRFLKAKVTEGDAEWLIAQGFTKDFVNYLVSQSTDLFKGVNIWSVEEGTIVLPYEPILRVEGPSIPAQLLETYLLNQIGYPSLIATKALRCVWAAKQYKNNFALIEMGLRRSPTNAGHFAARSACIAGFSITSDALAAQVFGLPVSGSSLMHADIQRRGDEVSAFRSFYEFVSYKDKVIFLIDTYDVIQGAQNAVTVAKEMRKNGHELYGVRIDSGDVTMLIPKVKQVFSEAGFSNVKIMLSGDMDEYRMLELAKSKVYPDFVGVGTQLVTGGEKSDLGVVYKLKAIVKDGQVIPRIKISADKGKTTLPGSHQVFRVINEDTGQFEKDVMGMHNENLPGEQLLKQVVFNGKVVKDWTISDRDLTFRASKRLVSQVALLPENVLDFEKDEQLKIELSEETTAVLKSQITAYSVLT